LRFVTHLPCALLCVFLLCVNFVCWPVPPQ